MNGIKVPFLDLTRVPLQVGGDEINFILKSGRYILGSNVVAAEEMLADFLKLPYVALTNSCTDALKIALLAVGVRPGDRVVLPALSFAATLNAVTTIGAIPVFADTGENGSGFNWAHLEQILRTHSDARVVIGVHLYGHPFCLKTMAQLAKTYGLTLIEDCAQWCSPSAPPEINSIRCYSFDPTKTIYTFGTCGATATADRALHERIRAIRSQGRVKGHHFLGRGLNSKPNEILALGLMKNLNRHGELQSSRANIVSRYRNICDRIGLMYVLPELEEKHSTWSKFVILSDDRDRLESQLKDAGIETQRHYDYLLPDLVNKYQTGEFPNARRISLSALSLPLFPGLMTEELDYISRELNRFKEVPKPSLNP